ncbi:MAG: GNAT family N-acetyltransferase [Betaproteobacteria bacterium]|nr:GNAT family N-acetyltransferase [Betaproteobacteria bacterium]
MSFRRDYWTRNADEPDAPILWSGIRQEVGRWLAGESTIVIGALANSDNEIVASRSLFSRSPTCSDLWYYGYFYTLPNFRRMGLGERVMHEGLAEIAKLGARNCSCYVAENNHASADLAIKLGFKKLPFVRVVFRGTEEGIPNTVHHELVETSDVRLLAEAMTLIDQVIDRTEGAPVITDELFIRPPWLPWKIADSQLIKLEHNQIGTLGIARIGRHKAVFLPNRDVLTNDPATLLLSAASALNDKKQRPVFAFLSRRIANSLRKTKHTGQYEIFNIFWHARLQQKGS